MDNPLAKTRLIKIVINIGLKEALTDKKIIETVGSALSQITGQRPLTTYARKAIAAFKLRKGEPVGLKVTLRGKRMSDFCQKLIKIVLPRVRDFKGISPRGFDGRGNYTLAIEEMAIFPEVDFAKISPGIPSFAKISSKGLEITFVTTAKNDEEGRKLLEELGMPFSK